MDNWTAGSESEAVAAISHPGALFAECIVLNYLSPLH
jgi:hypothetical protein